MGKDRMPVIFVGHGSPTNALGANPARQRWIELGRTLGKPTVIIAISAHWTTQGLKVRPDGDNPQIFDMYGFPRELYQVRYQPAGSPAFAAELITLTQGQAAADSSWGLDHGVWTVLSNMYPQANVPVVMVSTDITASPAQQFETGRQLTALRDQGALIMASGNVVHNLALVDWDSAGGFAWADRFDKTIQDAILARDYATPIGYQRLADHDQAVPTVEHYYPLLTALGAVRPDDEVTVFNSYRELGSLSMTSYLFC